MWSELIALNESIHNGHISLHNIFKLEGKSSVERVCLIVSITINESPVNKYVDKLQKLRIAELGTARTYQ